MTAMIEMIHNVGFVPVVALHDAAKAVGLANALARGGIPVVEVTYRSGNSAELSGCDCGSRNHFI